MHKIRRFSPYVFSAIILLNTFFSHALLLKAMGSAYTYVYLPLFWAVIGAAGFFVLRGRSYPEKMRKNLRFWVCLVAIMYLMVKMMSGIIDGFGYSPYDTSFAGILRNLFAFGVPILGKELARGAMLSGVKGGRKKTRMICILVCVVLALSDMNMVRVLNNLGTPFGVMEQIGGYFMPSLASSALLTLSCLYSGCTSGIIYRLITNLPFYILPVMPDNTWLTISLLGTLLPFCAYILINYEIGMATHRITRRDMKKDKPGSWIATFAFLLVFVLFVTGVLPYYPVAVATGSMEPNIMTGDMVIIDKTEEARESLGVGDVIQFKRGSYTVIHRIIEINDLGGGVYTYVTKGDNNDSADSGAVAQPDVIGRVVFRVRYLGWLTLWMHSQNVDNADIDVETGR